MGYCVEMNCQITIPKRKAGACLKAINALHTDENLLKKASGGSFGGNSASLPIREQRCYAWVSNPPEGKGFKDLKTALGEWRYDVHVDPKGDIHVDYFNGEKWGDDEVLYDAIAPFVTKDGSIECRGEDGAQWRYLFNGKEAKQQSAKISWE